MKCPLCKTETDRIIKGRCPSCFTRDVMAKGRRPVEYKDLPENEFAMNSITIIRTRRDGLVEKYIPFKILGDPGYSEPAYHDDFEKTFGTENTNTMHEAFRKAELIDTDQGAGALNKTKKIPVLDPEKLAMMMPGRNFGYVHGVKKPKCPTHDVSVDDTGYCPVCNRRVVVRFNHWGNPQRMFEKPNNTPDRYIKLDKIRLHTKPEGKRVFLGEVEFDSLRSEPWLKDEPIGRCNFDGKVNKKSDGRCAKTGSYPSPTDPDRMKKHRHNSIIRLDYNVEEIFGDESVYCGSQDVPVHRVKKDLRGCPECDCKFSLSDMRRGDRVCPKCGLMKGVVMMNQGKSRGGNDDKDYGDG